MWSFDGVKFSDEGEPIPFLENEHVRVALVPLASLTLTLRVSAARRRFSDSLSAGTGTAARSLRGRHRACAPGSMARSFGETTLSAFP